MVSAQTVRPSLNEAFERIEGTILPTISLMLDTLLDAASLARPGIDAAAYQAEIRTIALELEGLTRQVEGIAPAYPAAAELRISA
jgi:hypothetical protein